MFNYVNMNKIWFDPEINYSFFSMETWNLKLFRFCHFFSRFG